MDAMNLLGLTCAVLAALAFGVLMAYTCCQALFAMLHIHSRPLHSGSQTKGVEAQVQASCIPSSFPAIGSVALLVPRRAFCTCPR